MINKLANDIAQAAEIKLATFIISPIRFPIDVAAAGEHMKNLSTVVSKYFGKEKANKFLKSIDSLDYDSTNGILEDLVKVLIGKADVNTGLRTYGFRFPEIQGLADNLWNGRAYAPDKIRVLNKYMPEILNTINTPGPSLAQKAIRGGAIGAGTGAGIGGAIGLYKVLKNRHNYKQNMLNKIKGDSIPGPAPTVLGDLKTIGKNMAGYGTAGGALGAVGGIARKGNGIKYSDKDRDFMTLIQTLSTIYDKTDDYLNR